MDDVLTIIMAGGQGTRLSVLAMKRAKPAVPFGGIFRIIDFALSNVMHSGLRNVGIITQYRPYSLSDHVGQGEWWGLFGFGRVLKLLSPHTGDKDSAFYCNTADAIYRNIEFIERFPKAREVLILSGDHIYQMDYRPMIAHHRETGAKLTIATQTVPWEDTPRFGIMVTDAKGRITQFQEKPKQNPLSNKASLGIYVFDRQVLLEALKADHHDATSEHDFGGDIIPRLIAQEPVYHYAYEDFWRDVGTIPSYVEASMELLDPASGLDLEHWGVRTNYKEIPLPLQHPLRVGGEANVQRSLVSRGSYVGGRVENCILSPGVTIGEGSVVRNSILLHNVTIGSGCHLEHVIADKHATIGNHVRIGELELGRGPNQFVPHLLSCGHTVIGKGAWVGDGVRLGRNTLIYPYLHVTPGEHPCGACFRDLE